jgi:hypothetical protein
MAVRRRSARARAVTVFAVWLAIAASFGCEALVSTGGLSGGPADVDSGPGSSDHTSPPPSPDASGDAATDGTLAPPPDAPAKGDTGAAIDAGVDATADALDATAEGATDASANADGDADAGACPPGRILCGSTCVDPTSDPSNCNGCGNVCHTGLCGAALSATMQTQPTGWTFNGTATYSDAGPSASMTVPNVLNQAGSVIYRNTIAVDDFTANFAIRIGYGGGSRNDGMGFTIQKTGPTALAGPGEGLAMTGLDGYGVEFDIYENAGCGDVSNDHVGVDSLANCPEASPLPTSLFSADLTGLIDIADAQWHQVVVTLQGGAMSVHVDGTLAVSSVALTGFVPGTSYYFGFAGATGGLTGGPDGGGGYQTEVKDVAIAFPTPRCL